MQVNSGVDKLGVKGAFCYPLPADVDLVVVVDIIKDVTINNPDTDDDILEFRVIKNRE